MRLIYNLALLGIFLFGASFSLFAYIPATYADDSAAKRAQLEQQLKELETEANALDKNLQQVSSEKQTLANELTALNTEVKRRELEIKRIALVIKKTEIEIQNKTADIAVLSRRIDKNRDALASSLLVLYTYDQDNVFTILLKNKSLSDFFGSLNSLEKMQKNIQGTLMVSKEEKTAFESKKHELQGFEQDQQELKGLQDVERRFLAEKRKRKDEILRLTKGKEALFQQLLNSKKRDITALKTQLFYLEKTGITAENAVRFADLAAKRAGIRTAFLLALLEVETGKQFEDGVITAGTNLGTGNWQTDLYNCYIRLGKRGSAEAEKKAFLNITGKLNFDPDKMPVSRKPSYGCGGAMGPAQFLPTTWLRFESRVVQLTGHNPPNPWSVEDAFTAAAVFLADAGAGSQTTIGETAAAKTYISGNPRCTKYICRSYSSRIISLARDIDQIL